MIIPTEKKKRITVARKEIDKIEDQFKKGIITRGERHNKIIDVWTTATDDIAKEVFKSLQDNLGKDTINPVYLMMDSGAGQPTAGKTAMRNRGLMAKPSGRSSSSLFLHLSAKGCRFWSTLCRLTGQERVGDTALKTADAGYLTRKLCGVAMDCIIVCKDDGRRDGS